MKRLLKTLIGLVISALIVGTLYGGPAILGIIYSLIPHDMIEVLTPPERRVVYDGAWEVSDIERDGDMDGDLDEVVDPSLPLAEKNEQGAGAGDQGGGAGSGAAGEAGSADDVLAMHKPKGRAPGGTPKGKAVRSEGTPGKKATRSGKTRRKSRHKCPKTYDGIKKLPNGSYEVSRKLVNYYTASISHFNELGWSKSNDEGDGKGWYITGFGCKDPLWHAGMRRRDIVLRVNGKKTNNMMQILFLYSKVKAQKRFSVKVRRKKRELTLNYVIVK